VAENSTNGGGVWMYDHPTAAAGAVGGDGGFAAVVQRLCALAAVPRLFASLLMCLLHKHAAASPSLIPACSLQRTNQRDAAVSRWQAALQAQRLLGEGEASCDDACRMSAASQAVAPG
jgi:hypothetical protein